MWYSVITDKDRAKNCEDGCGKMSAKEKLIKIIFENPDLSEQILNLILEVKENPPAAQ